MLGLHAKPPSNEGCQSGNKWTREWQLPLNINKCRAPHLGPRNVKCNYILNGMMVQKTEAEKDLGIIIDNEMKFHIQNASTVKKANSTVYRILGSAEIFLQHGPFGFRSCQLIF